MADTGWQACAALVEKGDPLRFRTVMAAPVSARAKLFPLYAFNLEVARAPWVTAEPMIAEMRLQWWRDALEEIGNGGPVRRHEVATPLASVLSADDAKRLDLLVAARIWDCYRAPFEDGTAFETYIDQTSGNLVWTAARVLGAKDEAAVRAAGWGAGLATFFHAIPALEKAGRVPLVDGRPEAVSELAQKGLDKLVQARQVRLGSTVLPALWPASGADKVLRAAVQDPSAVADGRLPEMRAPLWWNALRGKW